MRTYIGILCVVLLAILASCAPKINKTISGTNQLKEIYYPAAPDTARVQYLTSISSSDQIRKSSKFQEAVVGKRNAVTISKPYGISTQNGKLIVSDMGNNVIDIIDVNNYSFEVFIPTRKHGQLLNNALDDKGNLYMLDVREKKVFVYNNNNKFIKEVPLPDFIFPFDISIKANKVWITDTNKNRVNVFNLDDFSLIDYYPKENTTKESEEYLYQPTHLAVSNDYVYIVDRGGFNIKVFKHNGDFVRTIGAYGRASGQLTRPKGIAVDNNEYIYIVDAAFQNLQIFNNEGQLLLFFGHPLKDAPGLNLPANVCIGYDNLDYYKKYVDPKYDLQSLIYVTNQFGDNKIMVYGLIQLKN